MFRVGSVILSGGLGEDEWVILIKAFTLLPVLYWDATRDAKQDADIEGPLLSAEVPLLSGFILMGTHMI